LIFGNYVVICVVKHVERRRNDAFEGADNGITFGNIVFDVRPFESRWFGFGFLDVQF
jgi:hypothetical protein